MRISTMLMFLFGSRASILAIAADRRAVWIGLAFVLSAGLAREYDHESLWHEPWHVLIPLGASLVASGALFLLFYAMPVRAGSKRPNVQSAFRGFLGLFWMTAPLAWLYAIPYERMMSAADATAANLTTLAIVAGWRVLLMTRVMAVTLNISTIASFMIVMLVADAIALTTLFLVPLPIINIMGGVSLTESERLISEIAVAVGLYGFVSAPIWLIGAAAAFARARPDWSAFIDHSDTHHDARSGYLSHLAAASIVLGLLLLPLAQPEQTRRYHVERLLRDGEIAEAFALMSQRQPGDFPPHWDPPPRPGYGERVPDIGKVAYLATSEPAAQWVRDVYMRKFDMHVRREVGYYFGARSWPEAFKYMQHWERREEVCKHRQDLLLLSGPHSPLSADDREIIRRMIEWCDEPVGDAPLHAETTLNE